MANTNILLLKPVKKLGAEGDQVKVKAGFARNYLFPKKIAVPLTQSNKKQIEALERKRIEREASELDKAKEFAKKISGTSVAIAVKTGEHGRIFGSVTNRDLIARLAEENIVLERKQVKLEDSIKEMGSYNARIILHPDVEVELTFEVVSENPVEA
jgi:large subunit ribosomal protein L9